MKNYLTRANDDWGWGFFENAFNDFFKPTLFNGCGTANLMKTDVKETDDTFELAVDLPGFDKQDLKHSLDDGYLTIEAKKEDKQEEKEQPDPNKMSKENAEQMLQAAMQDEKETQEKVQQAMQQPQRKRLKKQW